MIWLDLFAQLFVHALAWCLAAIVTLGIMVLAVRAYVGIADWLDRPRVLRRRSRFSGGLS